uniref:Uncharacterized protein n=1 Tax=Rhizophora mucronata TaxID=61149 RepID=A0A2P2N2B5_RHIMU
MLSVRSLRDIDESQLSQLQGDGG